ncbi:DEAD/DEAH box helicase [Planctomyces sp. SH-PL62]|uniref:DEAD/DEAH box helicase n=1 Tax=Planctomyces sp. SH-PL62 TaxID=1636152 RepID=UPI00078C83B2|nr:DEAD/DEAH box helicase family protein [Planctomyces sp. SH-PL62]AMV40232.1 Type III restriction enzyme, res subunit [Planctomyces sp. SH-PL62]
MISLKNYQTELLGSLRDFLRQCSKDGRPEAAYQAVQEARERRPMPYLPVTAAGIRPGLPYVCLRVPTGGGKTLLACHATGIAMDELLQAERAVVLWLVPSNAILEQTANALRDPRHPYRRALELSCGSVEVLTIEEALRLSVAAVSGQTVVIVSTIQSFRVEDTTGRKVYDQNGMLAEHLLNLPPSRIADMLPGADGKPKPSLVNVLRLHRPIVIVDEAHNARTDLSFATLGNVLPSCVIEFTATPARSGNPSNVLDSVSAAELKAADMIKLPLRVITRHPSQRDQLVAEAITLRSDLERLAIAEGQATGEYLRPILLFQAERVDACEPLRERLVSEFGIPKDQIKISVGRLDELKDIKDISAPACPVRFIITVEKLREGWDCPFAYVLCSLKATRSATAIEQIVGRILRLPKAQPKQHPDLNCAYAFSVSESLTDVLAELREALVSNGFTATEAERIILPVTQGTLPLGVQPKTLKLAPEEIDADMAATQVPSLSGKARIDTASGEVTILVPLDDAETAYLQACVKTPEAKSRIKETVAIIREAEKAFGGSGQTRVPTPYEQGIDFVVPLLSVQENGNLFEFESTFLLEHEWKLSEKDATLKAGYNPLDRPAGKAGTLDVLGGKVIAAVAEGEASDFVATLHQQVLDLGTADDWTKEALVAWLDRHIPHQDIPEGESAKFLLKIINGLMAQHGIPDVSTLALDRFRLRDAVEDRINEHRQEERKKAFQAFLLPASELTVSPDRAINFKTMAYEPSWLYDGGFLFKKHYFGKPGELAEKTPGGHLTEEFKCAQFIDGLAEVTCWIRNLSRKPSSFRLQTSKDRFYPDFICLLNDGCILVVEYKGQHLFTDAEEKRAVGEVWASRSKGKCRFVMPTEGDFTSIVRPIIT